MTASLASMADVARETGRPSAPSHANFSLVPFSYDFLLTGPRLAQRAAHFAFSFVPEQFDSLLGKMRSPGSIIAEPTSSETINSTWTIFHSGTSVIRTVTVDPARISDFASLSALFPPETPESSFSSRLSQSVNESTLGTVISFILSKWALAAFVIQGLSNRVQFYASPNVPVALSFSVRAFFHIIPIFFLSDYAIKLLQAIRCQTSPDWAQLRYDDPLAYFKWDHAGIGGLPYYLSSKLLSWQDDLSSCQALNMDRSQRAMTELSGSFSLLWPLFLAFCLSHLASRFTEGLEGRPWVETGMTIFEHALAFAEADHAIHMKSSSRAGKTFNLGGELVQLTRPLASQLFNVPIELLLVALVSTLSHLSNNFLSIFGLRANLRLVTTAFWGITYMAVFLWSIHQSAGTGTDSWINPALFHFPTVCAVGFLPHITLLFGILWCSSIWIVSVVAIALSLPSEYNGQSRSFTQRVLAAVGNLQATAHLERDSRTIINWEDDFHTALLKVGFKIISSATDAVYVMEGPKILVPSYTWLESRWLDDFIKANAPEPRYRYGNINIRGFMNTMPVQRTRARNFSSGATGRQLLSGYAHERRAADSTLTNNAGQTDPQRSHSILMQSFQTLKGIFWLFMRLIAKLTVAVWRFCGICQSPLWLRRLAGHLPVKIAATTVDELWGVGDDNRPVRLPANFLKTFDTETAFRRIAGESTEIADQCAYSWLKSGEGYFGELDSSGEYQPHIDPEEDTTSVLSYSTSASEAEDVWEDEEDGGSRTPTRGNPYPALSFSRESTPASDDFIHSVLPSLLDPQTPQEREEAQILSRRLRHNGVLTRSAYRRQVQGEKLELLAPLLRHHGLSEQDVMPRSEGEEADMLEKVILEARRSSSSGTPTPHLWKQGAEGLGQEGPRCGVCLDAPRSIILEPCGCLALCDRCRVNLAINNFSTCVFCKRKVVEFRRLYAP